jgi:brefeldin A-resistance guanine nucleotide exchange factor 1
VQAGDSSVMVSELAAKLGRDFRAQLATLVLFRVIADNEELIWKSWKHVSVHSSASWRQMINNEV